MPRISFRTLARLLSLLAVLLLAVAIPGRAQAQCPPTCNTGEEPEDGAPEAMGIGPLSLAVSQPSVTVVVGGDDDYGFKQSTFRVRKVGPAGDTTDVTASFAYSATQDPAGPVPHHFTAVAVMAMPASGSITLLAYICDTFAQAPHCVDASATYVRTLPGVEVTPFAFSEPASAGPRGVPFWVRNTGTVSTAFQLAAQCSDMQTGGAVGCTAPAATAVLAPGAQQAVSVTATVVAGQDLSATLTATQAGAPGVQDAGWAKLQGFGTPGSVQAAPTVLLATLQSGGANDRGDCVTVATAARAAYECGDLRVAHALPAHRSRGRTWAPVLLYNTQHAHPRPTVYAELTLPGGSAVPDSVSVAVVVGGATHRASFAGALFRPGTPRQLGVQWDALSTATGTYLYDLQATAVYGTSRVSAPLASGEITIVNRAESPYGAGWWVAGLEQVMNVPGATAGAPQRKLWIGGDGSTQLFVERTAGQVWESVNPGGAPDTLRFVSATGLYFRRLKGGGEIQLNSLGQHMRTTSRLGHITVFVHAAENRLVGIWAPNTANGVDFSWMMTYNAQNRLVDVTAHTHTAAPRPVVLTNVGGRVTAIRDPDGDSVAFAYDTSRPNRINGQTDRRGTRTTYTYDTRGKLSRARLWMGTVASDAVDVVTDFLPAESKGVVLAGTAGTAGASVARGDVLTRINGPRTDLNDFTDLYLDRNGRVRRVVNPAGQTTTVSRGSTAFPALVTAVAGPTGQQLAAYDSRGRVTSTTSVNPYGTGWDAVTTYAYDDRWDRPDTVRVFESNGSTSLPLGGTSYTEYDTITGNTLWQRVGENDAAKVSFLYYGPGPHAGQLKVAVGAADAEGRRTRDSLAYDAVGNLAMTRSPAGYLSLVYRDGLGRDTLTLTPLDAATATNASTLAQAGNHVRQRTVYDVMDRVTHTESIGPARSYTAAATGFLPSPTAEERLEVVTIYDEEGAPLAVSRFATPEQGGGGTLFTEYQYDPAGRRIRETSSQSGTQTSTYDQGGNVVVAHTANGFDVQMRYDAAGRLVERTVPERTHVKVCDQIGLLIDCEPFPLFPNFGDALKIPAEASFYRYDAAGNQMYAENADAVVLRGYYPNGALKTDSVKIRAAEGGTYTAYGLQYSYDMAGRVRTLQHPLNLTGGLARPDSFYYHPTTGALSSATSRLNHGFSFRYDHAGRLTSIDMPGQVLDSMRYDLQGQLTWRSEVGGYAGVLHAETMQYDARGKLLQANNGASTFTNWYSGLGSLVGTDWTNLTQNVGRIAEEMHVDPLGNVGLRRTSEGASSNGGVFPEFENSYQPATGRLRYTRKPHPDPASSSFMQDSTGWTYDLGGNSIRSFQRVAQPNATGGVEVGREVETRSFYGADDRLRVLQRWDVKRNGHTLGHTDSGVWEEYRYDALGRRVLVRTRGDGGICNVGTWECTSSTTLFVWSGDQLLWELKTATGTHASAAGGNVHYFHAGGIDRPLVITKGSVSIIPHQNWRGQFARGTYPNGTKSDCTSYPASGCTPIQWPGERTTARHELEKDGRIRNWFGGLVDGMRDASGQVYMRNRYYDPASGQFTQPDPIGLAGGLNAFGFANGDPVSYSDPYGLSAMCNPPTPGCVVEARLRSTWAALGARADAARRNLLSLASNLPLIGDGNDAGTVLTGHDALKGEDVGLGGRAAAGVGLVLPVGGGGTVRTVADAAEDLAKSIGRNSVSIRTPNGLRRVDLVGRSHGGVGTPHVQTYTRHTNPQTGQSSLTRDTRQATPATMQDVRQAREAARRQGLLDP